MSSFLAFIVCTITFVLTCFEEEMSFSLPRCFSFPVVSRFLCSRGLFNLKRGLIFFSCRCNSFCFPYSFFCHNTLLLNRRHVLSFIALSNKPLHFRLDSVSYVPAKVQPSSQRDEEQTSDIYLQTNQWSNSQISYLDSSYYLRFCSSLFHFFVILFYFVGFQTLILDMKFYIIETEKYLVQICRICISRFKLISEIICHNS